MSFLMLEKYSYGHVLCISYIMGVREVSQDTRVSGLNQILPEPHMI